MKKSFTIVIEVEPKYIEELKKEYIIEKIEREINDVPLSGKIVSVNENDLAT